jgi:outer membrane receptor protein involved in Fe transport
MSSNRVAVLWIALLPVASGAVGQTTGTIQGRTADPAGGAIPGVTIRVSGLSLQGVRAVLTDSAGTFHVPALPPGRYVVRAGKTGFQATERAATVSLDATQTVDIMLEPATEESVTVSGTVPLIDFSSTTNGTNYTRAVISSLPVGRNYADIVRANPGVSTDVGQTEGRSIALTIYGATSAENQWIIDGVNTTNVLKGVQGKALNNEFVQEVEVKTGGYSAEYGRALGGVVNVITKSGGNEFHGGAFVYYDSSGTTAVQQFKPGDSAITQMRIAGGERYDYGADLGGFLLKDRLWFFAAYNRVTLDDQLSRVSPTPNVPTSAQFPLDSAQNLYSGKLTWNVASSTTVVASIFADPSTTKGAAGADPRQGLGIYDVTPPLSLERSTWYSARTQGGTDYGVRLQQLFGAEALATLQGSYHRDKNSLSAGGGIQYTDLTCVGGTPANPCTPPPEPNSVSGGYGFVSGPNDNSSSRRGQVAGSVTTYVGNHEIKAGGDTMDGQTSLHPYGTGEQLVLIRNEYGQRYYEHKFYAVSPEDPVPVASINPRAQVLDYGLFAQDSWRVSPGLTIDLGLRWDGEDTRDYAGQAVLRLNEQWQPRIGIVWDPWQNGATKIYASAGRFSYALPTFAAADVFANHTSLFTYNFDPVSVVQDSNVIGHPSMLVAQTGATGDPVDAGLKASTTDELTIGVERLFTPTLTVGLKGTYRRLNHVIEDRCDLDYTYPENEGSSCALINPGSNATFASGNTQTCNGYDDDQCSAPGPAVPEAKRIYRGIELLARQSVGNSLWMQASFVYSSLKGNYDGGVNQMVYGQTNPGVNLDFDYPAMWHDAYGTLALDRPYRLRFDGYWTTPWKLTVGLSAFVESGSPTNQIGYFNGSYGPVIFLVPRGSVGRLPTLWQTDLTLSYPILVGPATVSLQGYLFNIFNKQIAVDRDNVWSLYAPDGYPATIYDPSQQQTNPYYGSVTRRSNPRLFRAAVKVTF